MCGPLAHLALGHDGHHGLHSLCLLLHLIRLHRRLRTFVILAEFGVRKPTQGFLLTTLNSAT
jgi:hypothetical protein